MVSAQYKKLYRERKVDQFPLNNSTIHWLALSADSESKCSYLTSKHDQNKKIK